MPHETHEVVDYMDEVTSRALGEPGSTRFDMPGATPQEIVTHLDTADRHKDAGTRLPGPTRFASLKEVALRFARIYTTEQAGFNRAVLAALHTLTHNIGAVEVDLDQRLGRVQAGISSTELLQQEQNERLSRIEQSVDELRGAVFDLAQQRTADRTELAVQRSQLAMFLTEARRRLPDPFDREQLEKLAAEAESRLAPLYEQLEDTFRGSREQILDNQREYLPDILSLGPGAPVVDVGCGRGEWLELLRDHEVNAYGIDTNEQFVRRNQARGLDVRLGDAVEHLAGVEEGTIAAVTGFHIAEHLEFPVLVDLVDAALRALRPGGLLLFETPNPTNVIVGSSAFYLDPTHRNPLHPEFLRFLVTARGFVDVELRYLHPAADIPLPSPDDEAVRSASLEKLIDHLKWSFFGPLDYAVLGRKATLS